MVQRKVLVPAPRLVIVVVGLPGLVMVPEPLTKDHAPVPTTGVLAAMVAELRPTVWSGPASAAVGVPFTAIFTATVVEPQAFVAVTV